MTQVRCNHPFLSFYYYKSCSFLTYFYVKNICIYTIMRYFCIIIIAYCKVCI